MGVDAGTVLSLTRFRLDDGTLYTNRFENQIAAGRVVRCRHGVADDAWVDLRHAPANAWPGSAYPLFLGFAGRGQPWEYSVLSEDHGDVVGTLALIRDGDTIEEQDSWRMVRKFVMAGDTPVTIDWGGALSHLCESAEASAEGSAVAVGDMTSSNGAHAVWLAVDDPSAAAPNVR